MYNLHQLGWYSFQQLAITIAKEVFGQTVGSFLPTNDAGRDGCFTGIWKKNKHESVEGTYVFQCKFTNKVNRRLKPSDVDDEFTKVKKLVDKGVCDFYILFTNNGVSGRTEELLAKRFSGIGVKYFKIFDNEWIVQTIKENSRLRILVPRVYGLGDLTKILDARVYDQGKELLASLKDEFGKFVITSSYRRAAKAINQHGFVLLIGGPASGKTTIASSLAMAAMDLWKSMTMKLRNADEVVQRWDPDEPGQFFWIDDAFGVTRYESSLVQRWNLAMPHVKAMIKKNVRIIMTSRDYIYEEARKELKVGAFPLLNESKVVIDVLKLTDEEKRQILYNHIKMGDQHREFKTAIKPFLEMAATSTQFLPETARRLGTRLHTKTLHLSDYYVKDFVIRQREFFIDLLHNLDKHLIAALALIYMNDERLSSPLDLSSEELKSVEQLDSTKGKCVTALHAMRNNLVQLIDGEDESYWKFKHPTIGDAFSDYIKESPELIEIYIRGCDVGKLIHQATCGNLKLNNTIVIPAKFFPLMLARLEKFTESKEYKHEWSAIWGAERDILEFLAKRCSKEFLKLYISAHANILDKVAAPGPYLEISAEGELASKLNEFGLLPEKTRVQFVKNIFRYAVQGRNLYVFKMKKISALLNRKELADLRKQVTNTIIPMVQKVRAEKETQFDSSDDPGQHMSTLVEVLEILESEFQADSDISTKATEELENIKNWVASNEEKDEMKEREKLADDDDEDELSKDRSIFDDVDSEA